MMGDEKKDNKQTNKWRLIFNRWVYLVRLFSLISSNSPKNMLLIMIITILTGLIPLLSIFSLQQLVNSITLLGEQLEGSFPLGVILWMSLFIIAFLLQSVANIYGGMIRDNIYICTTLHPTIYICTTLQ